MTPPTSDERLKRLEDLVRNALESASDDRQRIASTLESLVDRQRVRARDIERVEKRFDALDASLDAHGETLRDLPLDILRRMDKKTLDALRRLQHLQGTVPGTELPPPPITRHISVNGNDEEGHPIPVHRRRAPWRDRDDEDTAVNIRIPISGGLKKIKMGLVRKAVAAAVHAVMIGAGAAITYAWHLISHAR